MSVTIYVIVGAILGFSVLMLVSGELSRKEGPSRPGRLALAAIMGFGVIGLSVKAVALVMLNSQPRLADAVDASRSFAPQDRIYEDLSIARGIAYPNRDKAWKALPATPPGTRGVVTSTELIDLGRRLFFDQRLSSTGTVSCASCHDITTGGDDGHSVSTGIDGLKGGRNAPTVYNTAFLRRLFWDGRARSLEEQAVGPLMNPVEMGLTSPDHVVDIVRADPDYVRQFQNVLGGPVTIDGIAKAIAAFERTLITNNAPYDRFVRGETTALSAQQVRGMYLFDDIGCRKCHQDPVFSVAGDPISGPFRPFPVFQGSKYVAKHDLTTDRGLNANGVWRVPSLRNVALTGPYFHNGAVDDLEEAVRVMATAQLGYSISNAPQDRYRVHRDEKDRPVVVKGKALTDTDVSDITAFLRALSGAPTQASPASIQAAEMR